MQTFGQDLPPVAFLVVAWPGPWPASGSDLDSDLDSAWVLGLEAPGVDCWPQSTCTATSLYLYGLSALYLAALFSVLPT